MQVESFVNNSGGSFVYDSGRSFVYYCNQNFVIDHPHQLLQQLQGQASILKAVNSQPPPGLCVASLIRDDTVKHILLLPQ